MHIYIYIYGNGKISFNVMIGAFSVHAWRWARTLMLLSSYVKCICFIVNEQINK